MKPATKVRKLRPLRAGSRQGRRARLLAVQRRAERRLKAVAR